MMSDASFSHSVCVPKLRGCGVGEGGGQHSRHSMLSDNRHILITWLWCVLGAGRRGQQAQHALRAQHTSGALATRSCGLGGDATAQQAACWQHAM
jgi:hypothetical protein